MGLAKVDSSLKVDPKCPFIEWHTMYVVLFYMLYLHNKASDHTRAEQCIQNVLNRTLHTDRRRRATMF
jgi:hypothetical protein